jgi:hypothetical protein
MSSVDELIEVAENLLEDLMKSAEEEITAEDERSTSIAGAVLAREILRGASEENRFHFYLGVDRPLGVSSDNLVDLSEAIKSVSLRAVEYHFGRGDFESWIRHLGDHDLADRLRLLRETNLSGEPLRRKIHEVLNSGCDELQRVIEGVYLDTDSEV